MADISDRLTRQINKNGLVAGAVQQLIETAIAEDLGDGPDVTTQATIPPSAVGVANVVTRRPGVVCGLFIAQAVFELVGADGAAAGRVQRPPAVSVRPDSDPHGVSGISCRPEVTDGDKVEAGTVLMTVEGPLGGILTAERTALNFLGHLSGIATLTREWVDAVAGTGAKIRDTRKTLPGLRALEKYAVRCGGGVNHRMSLSDAALIKDNHVAAAGSVTAALDAVSKLAPDLPTEVECDTLDQMEEAVAAGAGLILLDNFGVDELTRAVELNGGRALLEASGGLRLESAAATASTGVDFLAVGALTHSAPVLDIGLDLVRAG
jgi:nicotinate-nucleotide pyrophosphorylase (carboxylating)